jgi:hypothetical protein
MPGHDISAQLARWGDWFTTAATPADRLAGVHRAITALAALTARHTTPAAADALRTRAAEALEALFDEAATALETTNTSHPATNTTARNGPR